MGKFKMPTLRNVELTAPYFHDGSAATLDDVLDNYAHGGRLITTGPYAGDGSRARTAIRWSRASRCADQEKADMIAFLQSLTDTTSSTIRSTPIRAAPTICRRVPGDGAELRDAGRADRKRVCAPCHAPGMLAANRPLADYRASSL